MGWLKKLKSTDLIDCVMQQHKSCAKLLLFIHSYLQGIYMYVCINLNSNTFLMPLADCSASEYRCRNGQCIEASKLCDYVKDCPDGEDEGEECRKLLTENRSIKCQNPYTHHTHTHPRHTYMYVYIFGRRKPKVFWIRLCVNTKFD